MIKSDLGKPLWMFYRTLFNLVDLINSISILHLLNYNLETYRLGKD